MVSLEWDPNYVPPVKLGLHAFQVLLVFVLWCLEIAVFNGKDAKITGLNGWTFGVCFLTIPAWVYLVMTPRFDRTRRFANVHAMLVVDLAFTIIWMSAFATQADYNTKDECGKVCHLSKGVVGLGVFVTVLFALTTLISGYTMQYYKFHGNLPGYDNRKIRSGEDIDPDKAAFSMAPHEDDAYERVNMDDTELGGHGGSTVGGASAYGGGGSSLGGEPYSHVNPYSADDYDDRSRYGASSVPPRNPGMFDDSTTEYSSGGLGNAPPSMPYGTQSDAYSSGPAQFPSGAYDRIER
jgi:uncharacterized membrane protein YgcG